MKPCATSRALWPVRDKSVLIPFAAIDETSAEDLCVRRNLAAIDRMEHMVLVTKRSEFVLLAKSPVLGIGVAHGLAVVARVGRRERELLVGGGKILACSGVQCIDFGPGAAKSIIPKEV